jgi:hypothetical protein
MAALDSMGANLYDEVKALPALEQWIIAEDQAGRARRGDVIVISGASSAYWEQSAELGQLFNRGRWAKQPFSHLAYGQTTIGAMRIQFGVPNRIAWFPPTMTARKTVARAADRGSAG